MLVYLKQQKHKQQNTLR